MPHGSEALKNRDVILFVYVQLCIARGGEYVWSAAHAGAVASVAYAESVYRGRGVLMGRSNAACSAGQVVGDVDKREIVLGPCRRR